MATSSPKFERRPVGEQLTLDHDIRTGISRGDEGDAVREIVNRKRLGGFKRFRPPSHISRPPEVTRDRQARVQ